MKFGYWFETTQEDECYLAWCVQLSDLKNISPRTAMYFFEKIRLKLDFETKTEFLKEFKNSNLYRKSIILVKK